MITFSIFSTNFLFSENDDVCIMHNLCRFFRVKLGRKSLVFYCARDRFMNFKLLISMAPIPNYLLYDIFVIIWSFFHLLIFVRTHSASHCFERPINFYARSSLGPYFLEII